MATQTVLKILDHDENIAISFEDILKYHGRHSIGGVAHGFQAMKRAFSELGQGQALDRYAIKIETAFPGPGARDAFEYVAHAVTGDRYKLDLELGDPSAVQAARGRYYYRISYHDSSVDLTLRPSLVADEFIALLRAGAESPDEKARLKWLKQDMTDRLLALPADEVYDIVE